MASQGNYDHPSYITRQQIDLDATTAGANGTSALTAFVSDMRIRKATAVVRTAGTSSGAGNAAILIYVGTSVAGTATTTTTATLGTITLGSSTAGVVVTSSDINAKLVAGGYIAVKNGTDATGVAKITCEMNLDAQATWT